MNRMKETPDILWDALNLETLVSSMTPVASLAESTWKSESLRNNKNKAMRKFQKLVEKPAYHAIMDRYQALPHKLPSINASKINQLADPLRLRSSRYEKLLHTNLSPVAEQSRSNPFDDNEENGRYSSLSPSKKGFSDREFSLSPSKKQQKEETSGFFITGGDMLMDDDIAYSKDSKTANTASKKTLRLGPSSRNKVELDRKTTNGLAAALRHKVVAAQRMDALKVPLLDTSVGMRNRRRLSPAVLDDRRVGKSSTTAAPRRPWEDINHVAYDQKRSTKGSKADDVNKQVDKKATVSYNKIVSSGYGAKAEKKSVRRKAPPLNSANRQMRLLKKLSISSNEPKSEDTVSRQDAVNARKKRLLGSKSTIDILEPIEETRRKTNAAALIGRNANKSGTKSAPALMRSAVLRPKGSADHKIMSNGNAETTSGGRNMQSVNEDKKWFSLEGLERMPASHHIGRANNQLSPLKPVKEGRKVKTPSMPVAVEGSGGAASPRKKSLPSTAVISKKHDEIAEEATAGTFSPTKYDLHTSIERLTKYEDSAYLDYTKHTGSATGSRDSVARVSYSKPEVSAVAMLAKHAKNLNAYFSHAQSHLDQYRLLADPSTHSKVADPNASDKTSDERHLIDPMRDADIAAGEDAPHFRDEISSFRSSSQVDYSASYSLLEKELT